MEKTIESFENESKIFQKHESNANAHFIEFKMIYTCKNCKADFYFNNKLHWHIRNCTITINAQIDQIKSTSTITSNRLQLINFNNKNENDHEFVFRFYRYVTIKTFIDKKTITKIMCINNDTFMSLINRKFFTNKSSQIFIRRMITLNNVRKIEIKLHDRFFYVLLNFYISEKMIDERNVLTHFNKEMHSIDNLKINVFINMNIMKSKRIKLNFEIFFLIISICENFKVSIQIKKRSEIMNQFVRVVFKMIISSYTLMFMSVKIRDKSLSRNKDYIFQLKAMNLRIENKFFVHITNANFVAIQIRNVFFKFFILFKNFKIDYLIDYAKKEFYMTNSKQRYLIIVSKKIDWRKILTSKTMLQNEIIVYENESTMNQISTMIKIYLQFFKKILDTMLISFD